MPKDEEIIADYLKGNEEAFDKIVKLYLKPVHNFIYRLVGNTKETEDITQESFIKVWKNIKKFKKEKASFKTWLFGIARNTAIDHLRKRRDYLFFDLEKDEKNSISQNITDPEPWPDELAAKAADKKLLEELASKIAPIYREIIVLHYQEDLTLEETSRILKTSVNTIKSRHRRALIQLRKFLEDAPKE